VKGSSALQFLRSLPRSASPRFSTHVTGAGAGLRLTTVPGTSDVPLRGIARLRLLERIAPEIIELMIGHDPETGATSWIARTQTATLSLLLSPDVARGFSGEGQALVDLADEQWRAVLPRVRATLRWQSRLDPTKLATENALEPAQIRGALAALGSRGLVGYDARAGAYFHRELPFDVDRVAELHPRLQDAKALVEAGDVRVESQEGDRVVGWVKGTDTEHHVRLGADGDDRSSCAWWAKHRGERGPCKHVLALRMVVGAEE
jgi:hypothetical protein